MNEDERSPIDWAMLRRMFGIKMGPGIMGRSLQLSLLLATFGSFFAWLFKDTIIGAIGFFAVLGLIFYVVRRAFNYAEDNPLQALLEGSELLKARQGDQTAKNVDDVYDSDLLPNREPPLAITQEEEGDA